MGWKVKRKFLVLQLAILINSALLFTPSNSFLFRPRTCEFQLNSNVPSRQQKRCKLANVTLFPYEAVGASADFTRQAGKAEQALGAAEQSVASLQDAAAALPTPSKLSVVGLLREGASSVQLAFERMGPRFSSLFVNFLVPIACILGYVVTPSRRVGVSLVGAGVLGFVVAVNWRHRLEKARRGAAQVTVARAIVSGLTDLRTKRKKQEATDGVEQQQKWKGEIRRADVEEVLSKYGLTMDQMESELLKVYQLHVEEMTQNVGSFSMAEDFFQAVDRLTSLKRALGLNMQFTAEAHVEAARKVYSESDERKRNNFLFLSERVIASFAPERELLLQMSRIGQELGLQPDAVKTRVQSVALPFYRQILKAAITNPEGSSAASLASSRKSLGLDSLSATSLHLEGYSMKVKSYLESKAVPLITEAEMESLAHLRGVLGISQFEGDRSLEASAAPIYRELVVESIETLVQHKKADAADMKDALEKRLDELKLTVPAAKNILKEAIRRIFLEPFNVAIDHLREGKLAELVQDIEEIQKLRIASSKLLAKDQVGIVMTGILTGSPKVVVSMKEKIAMFGIYLSHLLLAKKEPPENSDELLEYLKIMLRLSSAEVDLVKEGAFREAVKKEILAKVRADDMTPESLTEIEQLATKLTLSQDILGNFFEEVYALELTLATDTDVITTETKKYLDNLVAFFKLRPELVQSLHDKQCGPIFKKVISELAENGELESVDSQDILKEAAVVLGISDELSKKEYEKALKQKK